MERILAEIRVRADTWDNWITKNPILGKNEPATVLDGLNKGKLKIGDGVTLWNDLEFAVGQTGAPGTPGKDGAPGRDGVGNTGWAIHPPSGTEWVGVPAVGNYILAMGSLKDWVNLFYHMPGTLVTVRIGAIKSWGCCPNGHPQSYDYIITDNSTAEMNELGTLPGVYRCLGRSNFYSTHVLAYSAGSSSPQQATLLQRVA